MVWLLIWAEAYHTHGLSPSSSSGVPQSLGKRTKDGAQMSESGWAPRERRRRAGAGGQGAVELSAVLKVGAASPGDGRAGALSVVLKMPLVRAAGTRTLVFPEL